MKKLINVRNLIIVILCLTIISLGIGFAFLSIELEKHSNKNLIFDVSITSVRQNTSIMGGTISPTATHTITDNKKTISTQMSLYAPYDEVSYTIRIENTGTIPAEISDIIETPNYLKDSVAMNDIYPVEVNHIDIVGKVLEPGESIDLTIAATYKQAATITPKTFNYQLSVISKSYQEE